MKTKLISIVSINGGIGKTTLIHLFAKALSEYKNKSVLILDFNKTFYEIPENMGYDYITCDINYIKSIMLENSNKYDFIFIDMEPNFNIKQECIELLKICDKVFVPTRDCSWEIERLINNVTILKKYSIKPICIFNDFTDKSKFLETFKIELMSNDISYIKELIPNINPKFISTKLLNKDYRYIISACIDNIL